MPHSWIFKAWRIYKRTIGVPVQTQNSLYFTRKSDIFNSKLPYLPKLCIVASRSRRIWNCFIISWNIWVERSCRVSDLLNSVSNCSLQWLISDLFLFYFIRLIYKLRSLFWKYIPFLLHHLSICKIPYNFDSGRALLNVLKFWRVRSGADHLWNVFWSVVRNAWNVFSSCS